MQLYNSTNNDIFRSNFKLISLITAVSVTTLFSLVDQTGWAAVITCPAGAALCNGTEGDDIITGTTDGAVIRGLGGNDYIKGDYYGFNYIYGDDGNDILIGGFQNDGLYGGNGSDRYDGLEGDDSIYEVYHQVGSFVNNDDIISGGVGNDFIISGEGSDRIEGGPGNEYIMPNGAYRDFFSDIVNCGSGNDVVWAFHSGDGDTALNCETIANLDG